MLQNYNEHYRIYAPTVAASKLQSREGDRFTFFLRFVMKKVITVVVNSDHEAVFRKPAADRAEGWIHTRASPRSRTRTTDRAREAGRQRRRISVAAEHVLAPARAGRRTLYSLRVGVALARDSDRLRLVVGPFVTSIPRESLTFTLETTRNRLEPGRDRGPVEKKPARTNCAAPTATCCKSSRCSRATRTAFASCSTRAIRFGLDPASRDPTTRGSRRCRAAMQALQLVADTYGGALVDALLDPRNCIVRRRLARVLSVSRSQIVADGLLMAVEDPTRHPHPVRPLALRIRRRRRTSASMRSACSIWSIRAGPGTRPTCVISLRCYRLCCRFDRCARPIVGAVSDQHARGTALEYLHGVLPKDIRAGCWGNGGLTHADRLPRHIRPGLGGQWRAARTVCRAKPPHCH